jgi:hypothetical protein
MYAVVMAGTAQHARAQAAGGQAAAPTAQPQKKVKDQGEYDIYNNVIKDFGAQTWPKLQQDLDIWVQKYADSDYKDDRLYYYVWAYNGTKQPGKELDLAGQLLARDLKSVYTDPAQILRLLFMTCANIQAAQTPTAEQTATGEKAAHALLDFVPTYFVAANKPAGTGDADWAKAAKDVETLATETLKVIATRPGMDLLQKYRAEKDAKYCDPAEAALTTALKQFPDNAIIAYNLASAELCQRQAKPEKIPVAIYEFARAAVATDRSVGASVADPKTVETYLTTIYTNFHGADDDGLKQLKDLAAKSPFPPADFKIESSSEVARRKEEEFKKTNPQLALWMGIKGQLADTNGDQYFTGSLKDADVKGGNGAKALKGTLVDAKPACRSKELLVAISDATHAEVTLNLDAALTGKPDTGVVIQWDGQPTAFTKEPFMLTMDTEKANITGLNLTPCVAAPVKKAAPKKSAPKKSAD